MRKDVFHRGLLCGAVAAMAILGTPAVTRAEDDGLGDGYDWSSAGHDIHNSHNAPGEHEIGRHNADKLKLKWAFTTAGDVSATPVVDEQDLYVPDWGGFIYRIDTRTGKAIWSRRVADLTGVPGAVSRTSAAIAGDLIVFGTQRGARMFAVHKRDGSLAWSTLADAHPAAIITSSPVLFHDRIYVGVASNEEAFAADPDYSCCSFRGSVISLDVHTGAIKWKTYTVPQGFSGGAVWGSTAAIDIKRHSLYIGTGNNYSVPASVQACAVAANGDPRAMDACLPGDDYVDALVSLDLDTGHVKWGRQMQGFDAWTVACAFLPAGVTWCPSLKGPDYDFGSAPNFFTARINGKEHDLVGAGQKSGMYWALNPDDGEVVWSTLVGPGSSLGGIQWGSAVDPRHIYVSVANYYGIHFGLQPSGAIATIAIGGAFSALDPATGKILWQVADPTPGAFDLGFVSSANGLMYAGSLDPEGHYYALDGETGKILWSYASGGSVISGAAIVNGKVYWGSGYSNAGLGTRNDKLYAFEVSAH